MRRNARRQPHRTRFVPSGKRKMRASWVGGRKFIPLRPQGGEATILPADRGISLAAAGGFVEEPDALLGLVDPGFEEAGGGDVAMLVAEAVRLAHPRRQ